MMNFFLLAVVKCIIVHYLIGEERESLSFNSIIISHFFIEDGRIASSMSI